jgi:hypothetical protein
MKSVWVVAVLIVVAGGAWAQIPGITPRAIGMGGAATGVADDAGAWMQNPAGLAALNVMCPEGATWGHDVIAAYANIDDADAFGITWGGMKPENRFGAGAGWINLDGDLNVFGAGAGMAIGQSPFSAGASFAVFDPDGGDSEIAWNVGLMYRVLREEKAPIRLGMTINDISDEFGGAFWNFGASGMLTEDLLAAVDVLDLSDEVETTINAGLEYTTGNADEWKLRAGLFDTGDDHEITLGVGYAKPDSRWRVDFGWANTDPEDLWTLGVGVGLN